MTHRGTHVATFLSWLVLAVSIPLLLFTVGAVWRLHSMERRQQEAALGYQARDASRSLDRTFERVEDGLRTLAAASDLGRGDPDSFGPELRQLSERLGNVTITLAAPDGSVLLRVAGSRLPADRAPADMAPVRQAVSAALRAGAPVISNLLPGGDQAQQETVVAVPVFRAGVPAASYVLVAEVDSARLMRLAAVPPPNPDGLVIMIHDRDGVRAGPLSSERSVGEAVSPSVREGIAGQRSGVLPDRGPSGGAAAIRAFSVAPVSGYTVVAALPRNAFGARIRKDLIETLLIGTVLLIIGLLAAACLARRLVGALRRLGQGTPGAVPSGLREVDELAVRLRALAQAREATERTLRDSERQLRDLVGTLDLAAIMVRDLSGAIHFWSRGCARLYGWSREEAVGRASHDLLRTQFPVPLPRIEETLLTSGEWKGDLVHRRRDGSVVITAAHMALQRDLDGRPHRVIESLVDATALREAQETLRTINQELEHRVRNEVTAREAAQRRADHADRIQALGQLAGGIAHDFNNVLQAVAGGAALIAQRPQDREAVERLARIISDAAGRGASITRRMLLLAHRGSLNAEPVEVLSLLTGMREVFLHTLGAEVDVQVEVAAGLPRLLADQAQLETALVNLAANARDAMPDGGTLRLIGEMDRVAAADQERHPAGLSAGAYVRLSVVDDGSGMTDTTLMRAAEPFFTSKDVGKGTGLGLSMVKGFADQSGGGFAIDSTFGVGTKVTLWLPSVSDDVAPRPTEAAAEESPRLFGRILLVDDDQLVRDTLTEQLEELGHKVLGVSCATDALTILQALEAVDLMITDLSMPGMNGLTLIKEAQGLRPRLPAILLTGYSGEPAALQQRGMAHGSYQLVRKPATRAVLGARVTALLERSQDQNAA